MVKGTAVLASLSLIASIASALEYGFVGKYRLEGASCDVRRAEADWVFVTKTGISATHLECRFTSKTTVNRMPSLLFDADCSNEGMLTTTRFFISQYGDGIVVFSPAFGLMELAACPAPK